MSLSVFNLSRQRQMKRCRPPAVSPNFSIQSLENQVDAHYAFVTHEDFLDECLRFKKRRRPASPADGFREFDYVQPSPHMFACDNGPYVCRSGSCACGSGPYACDNKTHPRDNGSYAGEVGSYACDNGFYSRLDGVDLGEGLAPRESVHDWDPSDRDEEDDSSLRTEEYQRGFCEGISLALTVLQSKMSRSNSTCFSDNRETISFNNNNSPNSQWDRMADDENKSVEYYEHRVYRNDNSDETKYENKCEYNIYEDNNNNRCLNNLDSVPLEFDLKSEMTSLSSSSSSSDLQSTTDSFHPLHPFGCQEDPSQSCFCNWRERNDHRASQWNSEELCESNYHPNEFPSIVKNDFITPYDPMQDSITPARWQNCNSLDSSSSQGMSCSVSISPDSFSSSRQSGRDCRHSRRSRNYSLESWGPYYPLCINEVEQPSPRSLGRHSPYAAYRVPLLPYRPHVGLSERLRRVLQSLTKRDECTSSSYRSIHQNQEPGFSDHRSANHLNCNNGISVPVRRDGEVFNLDASLSPCSSMTNSIDCLSESGNSDTCSERSDHLSESQELILNNYPRQQFNKLCPSAFEFQLPTECTNIVEEEFQSDQKEIRYEMCPNQIEIDEDRIIGRSFHQHSKSQRNYIISSCPIEIPRYRVSESRPDCNPDCTHFTLSPTMTPSTSLSSSSSLLSSLPSPISFEDSLPDFTQDEYQTM